MIVISFIYLYNLSNCKNQRKTEPVTPEEPKKEVAEKVSELILYLLGHWFENLGCMLLESPEEL